MKGSKKSKKKWWGETEQVAKPLLEPTNNPSPWKRRKSQIQQMLQIITKKLLTLPFNDETRSIWNQITLNTNLFHARSDKNEFVNSFLAYSWIPINKIQIFRDSLNSIKLDKLQKFYIKEGGWKLLTNYGNNIHNIN